MNDTAPRHDGPIKVLIVDDSAVVRQVATALLSAEADINVIGAVADPLFAMERMSRQWPDVIVLDIEMPRMDGLTFLRKLMSERPTPVVMCSALTEHGAKATLQALAAGAVGIISKPRLGVREHLEEASEDLISAVRAAARANVKQLGVMAHQARKPPPKLTADAVLSAASGTGSIRATPPVVAVGTSTGGTQALEVLLRRMPVGCPGLVIVQHMPEHFTASFAQRLNSLCEIEVREAQAADRVQPGRALIAPGGRHMLLCRTGTSYHVDIVDGPPVNRHRPSVDVLFRSAAKTAGRNAVGVIMTGMGDDGAAGLLEMKQAGAYTLAQDEQSCVVFGMPREAILRGAADQVAALDELPEQIIAACAKR